MENKNPANEIFFGNKIAELSQHLKLSGNLELIEHSLEVAQLARMIMKNMGYERLKKDKAAANALKYMSIDTLADIFELHDLGKIFIPDEILNKPGRLDDREFHYVYQHPETTKKLLDFVIPDKNSELLRILYDTTLIISMQHHENFDGTGYPHKLKGKQISLLGRIARVADVISALMGERCYHREFNSYESIANYLVKNKNALFDSEVVDIVINNNIQDRVFITKDKLLNVFDIQNEIKEILISTGLKQR